MKRYIFVVILLLLAVGVAITFLVLNYSRVNYSKVVASVISEGGGEISDPGELRYEDGGSARYIVTSYQGYHIKELKLDDKVLVSEKDFQTNATVPLDNIHGEHNLTVEFAADLTVTLNNIGVNGSLEYSKNYAYQGQDVEISIKPSIRDVSRNLYYPVNYINIDGTQYSVQTLKNGVSKLGYKLVQSDLTGEMKLTMSNVQEDISVTASFGINVIFEFGGYSTSYIMASIANLKYSEYEGIIQDVSDYANANGMTFTGWRYNLYSQNREVSEGTATISTIYESVLRLSNNGNKNVRLVAIFQ